MNRLRLGSRSSRLALIQSELVAARLREVGAQVDVVEIITEGDVRPRDAPIAEGVFVAALERGLRSGEIDIAVHSAKDVPLDLDPDLPLVAFPERADPRDALVTRDGETSLDQLRPAARVGTDSPRRTAFAHAVRPDLQIFPLMGNVDTRLARLDAGEADALILAAAGLDRLGLSDRIAARLEPDLVPPAPAQGALAVQARRSDREVLGVVRRIDDPCVALEVRAERALLKAFGGGYVAPVGAVAYAAGPQGLRLIAGAATLGGSKRHVVEAFLAEAGIAAGASAVARHLHQRVPVATRAVLDTRPGLDPDLASRYWRQGFRPIHVPTVAIREAWDSQELDQARRELGGYDWVVLTSRRGVESLFHGFFGAVPANVRWAAVGPSTGRALQERGIAVDAQPALAVGVAIPAAMANVASLEGARVLVARADAADPILPEFLRRKGAHVDEVVAYRSVAGPSDSREPLHRALLDPELSAVVFASPSAVRGFCELGGTRSLQMITIGGTTSAAAEGAGLTVSAEAPTPDAVGLSAALAQGVEKEVVQWLDLQTVRFD